MIQNLFCILEWSVLWHLYHQTMFKAHLTNLLLWFAINMEMVQMEFWTTSRIIMLGGSVSILPEVYQHSELIFEICFTTQMTSFQEQIIEGWHRGFQVHVSACVLEVSLSVTKGHNFCQSRNFTKLRCPPTSFTKRKISWLQIAYLQNCWWLPKSSKNWLFQKYSS